MKRILYLNNFMTDNIVGLRDNRNIYSQPANNKIRGITAALLANGCAVKIVSSGLVNNRSGKLFKGVTETIEGVDVEYCAIRDLPLINTLSSIRYIYRAIKREHKKQPIDNIIFYNYKPEVAWAAWLAKKKLHIPITVEYEDGYSYVKGMSAFKSWIFRVTENIVSRSVDSAILVNSQLTEKYSVPNVVVRGIVDENFLRTCNAYEKEENDKPTILYAGGLDKERGIDVLLKAVELLDMDCRVIVTGKGHIESNDSRVDFRGFLPYEEVQRLMMQCDVLVQCQLSQHEFAKASFPSKLFEYIATGNIIVSSELNEVEKFAGDAFVYYDNDDPKKLAEKLSDICKNVTLIESLSVKTRQLCEENLPKNVGVNILKLLS